MRSIIRKKTGIALTLAILCISLGFVWNGRSAKAEEASAAESTTESAAASDTAAEEAAVTTTASDSDEQSTEEVTVKAASLSEEETIENTAKKLIAYAKKFLGNPYRYGGTSLTSGTDCSGFVMRVFQKFDVSLPRSSREQAQCGKRVSLSNLKPGDLLFYGSSSYISHVAIYIGGGRIIHASNYRTGICIGSAWYRTPVKAVRILAS